MSKVLRHVLCLVLVCLSFPAVGQQEGPAHPVGSRGRQIPVTGRKTPGVEAIDRVMLKYLEKIGCTTATVAVARRGVLIHSRGYGWSDKDLSVPTRPDTMIGVASCEKPVTAAAIRQLARAGRLDLNASVFKLLKVVPNGNVVDERIWQITINNLLDHKPGWEGAPIEAALKAAWQTAQRDPVPAQLALKFIMVQRLSSNPGTVYKYCNECYDVLRYIVEKVSGKRPVDYFRTTLFHRTARNELRGFEAPNAPRRKGDPPSVWNDSGAVCASAPALCEFMRHYWFGGEPRDGGNPLWQKNGSMPGSTAMMLWRPDGINLVYIFNGRRDNVSHDDIKRDLEEALKRRF
jgi:CubicO group peptidase (beta-lactamase class C family)